LLYTYRHITHDFGKMHGFIEHLVLEVWCKPDGNYSIKKLHNDFIPIVQGIKNKNLLENPIRDIYVIFKNIQKTNKAGFKKLKNGFIANNEIENLCKGKGSPILYSQIEAIHKPLKNKLQKFFKDLYKEVPKNAAFKNVCGNMKTYYNDFLDLNESEKCPFCGISDIMTSRLKKRDAFDHYLPKDIYPFNTINPDNLAPICKTCNSSYKLAKNPIRSKTGKKRKAFFPFSKTSVKLNISAKFDCADITKLKPNEVTLKISNKTYQEQIETWKDLFGIPERYIDKFCSKDAKWWRIQMLDELQHSSKTKEMHFDDKLKLYESNYLEENNFLKIPYFNACRQMGILLL
jgi:hypothetical protein